MSWTRIDAIARYLVTDSTLYVWCSGSRGWGDFWRNLDPRVEQLTHGEWVESADHIEAEAVLYQIADKLKRRRVVVMGFSRGGAVAAVLARILPAHLEISLELYAPKRAGNSRFVGYMLERVTDITATAHTGDLVPFLPFWLAQPAIEWQGGLMWPWSAHKSAAKQAAKRRHEISKGRETVVRPRKRTSTATQAE